MSKVDDKKVAGSDSGVGDGAGSVNSVSSDAIGGGRWMARLAGKYGGCLSFVGTIFSGSLWRGLKAT